MKNQHLSWINTCKAAELAGVHPRTITKWCEAHRIGRKIAGRYRVDPAALEALLAGAATSGKVAA